MLSSVYQPMIGAYAVSIYHTLFHQLPADKSGYSPVEQRRKLFLALELESGERGRKFFIEQTSKLEAVEYAQNIAPVRRSVGGLRV